MWMIWEKIFDNKTCNTDYFPEKVEISHVGICGTVITKETIASFPVGSVSDLYLNSLQALLKTHPQ